jgi:hypothetical protein
MRNGVTRLKPSKAPCENIRISLKRLNERAIDGRTTIAKHLQQWRSELIADLGGLEVVSTQQLAIVVLAVRTKLMIDSVDNLLLTQPTIVNARKRTLLPVVLQRQQLADALARYMGQLGLQARRRMLDVTARRDSLATLLEQQ